MDKQELYEKFKYKMEGQANLDWLRNELGDKVFEWLVKHHSDKVFTSKGFWSDSWDGDYFVEINLKTGKGGHYCSVAAFDGDIHFATHKNKEVFAKFFRLKAAELIDKI